MAERDQFKIEPRKSGPLFFTRREKEFLANLNDELIMNVVGQRLRYYRMEEHKTTVHDLYDEAVEKTFAKPVELFARIDFQSHDVSMTKFTIDKNMTLEVFFHKRMLQDKEIIVREGDHFEWDEKFFEIYKVTEPLLIHGMPEDDIAGEIGTHALAKLAREGVFDGL